MVVRTRKPTTVDIFIHSDVVVAMDDGHHILYDGALAIDQGRIMAVAPTDEMLEQFIGRKTIDACRQAVLPGLPLARLATMESHLGDALVTPRVSAGILGLFSVLALLLASVGIYTIVSFSVAGRMPEIGIRVALGAQGSRVIRMVVGEVAVTVAVGLVVGVMVVATGTCGL